MPGATELTVLVFVLAIAALPAAAIYWDASRRGADSTLLWAIAMFFASWTLVGIVMGLLYYFVGVTDDRRAHYSRRLVFTQ